MEQYHDLAKRILKEGVNKSSGREGMPDTRSVFGHLMRFNLQEGFPLMTTKKVDFKNILVELIWFLNGDTNIKFLVDNGCNILNGDAYRWYRKICYDHKTGGKDELMRVIPMQYPDEKSFVEAVKADAHSEKEDVNYKLGDLGNVYGRQWRKWKVPINHNLGNLLTDIRNGKEYDLDSNRIARKPESKEDILKLIEDFLVVERLNAHASIQSRIDQIADLIKGLRENPYGRRHIVSAWNPADLKNMALPPCHLLVHFNCRPATLEERNYWAWDNGLKEDYEFQKPSELTEDDWHRWHDSKDVPNIMLDCLMYQRSTDVQLGLGYNIASYSILTEIIAKMTGKIAGEFIWTGGDTHLYENHFDAINTQLQRTPKELPVLKINDRVAKLDDPKDIQLDDFELIGYDPHPSIKAKLSVGTE